MCRYISGAVHSSRTGRRRAAARQPPVAAGLDDGSASMPLIPLFIPDSLSADANGSTAASGGSVSSGSVRVSAPPAPASALAARRRSFGGLGFFVGSGVGSGWLGRRFVGSGVTSGSSVGSGGWVGSSARDGSGESEGLVDGSAVSTAQRRTRGSARTGRPTSARRAGSTARRSRPCTSLRAGDVGPDPDAATRAPDPATVGLVPAGVVRFGLVKGEVAPRPWASPSQPSCQRYQRAVGAAHDLDAARGMGRSRAPCPA